MNISSQESINKATIKLVTELLELVRVKGLLAEIPPESEVFKSIKKFKELVVETPASEREISPPQFRRPKDEF